VNDEHGHVAMPKLYGAPAYARPPASPVTRSDRPFDPDDLPIEAEQSSEDRDLVAQAQTSSNGQSTGQTSVAHGRDGAAQPSSRIRIRFPRIGKPGS
jgi:hypothetical protein